KSVHESAVLRRFVVVRSLLVSPVFLLCPAHHLGFWGDLVPAPELRVVAFRLAGTATPVSRPGDVQLRARGKVTPVDEKKWKEDFVHLVVKVDDMQDLKTIIPLTSRRGHIFIQTDQPIYMPNSDVKSWLFAVTRQLNPIPFPLVVDIVNPDGVVVKRMKKSDWQVERMVVLEPFHIPAITR
uniref:Uncharacterized protein n=1 Tax=Eptatretus burgeri TaxID=7764 RepID=A0A8C4QK16_EPTBU